MARAGLGPGAGAGASEVIGPLFGVVGTDGNVVRDVTTGAGPGGDVLRGWMPPGPSRDDVAVGANDGAGSGASFATGAVRAERGDYISLREAPVVAAIRRAQAHKRCRARARRGRKMDKIDLTALRRTPVDLADTFQLLGKEAEESISLSLSHKVLRRFMRKHVTRPALNNQDAPGLLSPKSNPAPFLLFSTEMTSRWAI
ncbi:hypothetical protein KFL_002670085 [Klebsormidium nitens]|uniref:Uncharacterized protein n=1 Tax=Klebsormidium nitens TaxID=105231 RepID=A0A1Y1I9E5_KLENI|nr:hypothetical protein KFL_002670085 [Klebsormidium nitens]|eukprot:GAQ86049.1 hypothetical protein KFL_002670085 [Klebsormidium nitens]